MRPQRQVRRDGWKEADRGRAPWALRRSYTLVFASRSAGPIRKLKLSGALVHLILFLALGGAGTVLVAGASYTHLLLTASRLRPAQAEQHGLLERNLALQTGQAGAHRQLSSLESLADEMASNYGLMQVRHTPFGRDDAPSAELISEAAFRGALVRYRFLQHHAAAVTLYASGLRPLPGQDFTRLDYTPSLWPARGHLTASFGTRLDPFNGEGAFHAGVDISARYGDAVRAAAEGRVTWAGPRAGLGRLVVIDHGAGLTTWYGHLSDIRVYRGQGIGRGDVIGYVGSSGRSTAPHLHYEVRWRDAPVNPSRFLRAGSVFAAQARSLSLRGGDD